MRDIWERIENWFAEHDPDTRFPPGVFEFDIKRAEQALNIQFPKDLQESLRIHDGDDERSFYRNRYLMSLKSIIRFAGGFQNAAQTGQYDTWKVSPQGPIKPVRWDVGWIPIMDDSTGDMVCIDMNPLPAGIVGQVIEVLRIEGPVRVLASSWREWLTSFAKDLEDGKYGIGSEGGVFPLEERSEFV